jgi:hypothetical protein
VGSGSGFACTHGGFGDDGVELRWPTQEGVSRPSRVKYSPTVPVRVSALSAASSTVNNSIPMQLCSKNNDTCSIIYNNYWKKAFVSFRQDASFTLNAVQDSLTHRATRQKQKSFSSFTQLNPA